MVARVNSFDSSPILVIYLTQFYMSVATGGAIGGVFVALAAPYLFRGYWEYPFSVFIAAALFFWILIRDRSSWLYQPRAKSHDFIGAGRIYSRDRNVCL
jgi:hypothetical protein